VKIDSPLSPLQNAYVAYVDDFLAPFRSTIEKKDTAKSAQIPNTWFLGVPLYSSPSDSPFRTRA
jgi:hypothetical protein